MDWSILSAIGEPLNESLGYSMHGHIVRGLYGYLLREMDFDTRFGEEEGQVLKAYVETLREEYRLIGKPRDHVNHGIYHKSADDDEMLKIAYSLVYFPSYAFQAGYAWHLASQEHFGDWTSRSELNVVSIGGGPLPELIGFIDAICRLGNAEDSSKRLVRWLSLDINADWELSATRTEAVAKRILEACGFANVEIDVHFEQFDLSQPMTVDVLREVRRSDLVIAQNVLNEVPRSSRDAARTNVIAIADEMKSGSTLVLSDLLGYQEAVTDSFHHIAESLEIGDQCSLIGCRDFPKASGNRSLLRSPFWGSKFGAFDPWSPIPKAITDIIGFNDDGGSRTRRNLWCGFRVFLKR